jgi:hypothetical protein
LNQNQLTSQLNKIISVALSESESDGSVKTTVVNLHLAQMKEWGVRGGNVQIKAIQDTNGIRRDWIYNLLKENRIKQRLDAIMDNLVARGEVLWLVMPTTNNESRYEIESYTGGRHNPNPEYVVFYEDDNPNSIECVLIKTSIERKLSMLVSASPLHHGRRNDPMNRIYFLTFIDRQKILKFRIEQEPLNLKNWYYLYKSESAQSQITQLVPTEVKNPFSPDFPFIICKNIENKINESGEDDFNPHIDLIEEHNDLLLSSSENLQIFNNPTLVTSRDASTIVDKLNEQEEKSNSSWAWQNGFRSALNAIKKVAYRMPKIIGNVKEGERFGYIQTPDVISGDMNNYIRSLRELIHWCLGGIDPLGISANATFGEIKSLFGRIENSSMKKADSLLGDMGLCNLVTKILRIEETACKLAITRYIIANYLVDKSIDNSLISENLDDSVFRELYFYLTKKLTISLPGLPPLGKRDCAWRYTKDVFQRTTREMLDASIVYRNEREDGISQEIALSKLYPNMRDDEIRQSMSGFSPRVVTQAMEGIGAALQLQRTLSTTPDPENSQFPWEARIQSYKLVEQALLTLQKEITYNIPDFKEENNFDDLNQEIGDLLKRLQMQQNVYSRL